MQISSAAALGAIVTFTLMGTPTSVFAQEAPPPNVTQNFCVFRSEYYSWGAIICIGKSHALRCDGPSSTAKNSNWTLLQSDAADPGQASTLGDTCSIVGTPASQ
jgi:hypothetical protein